MATRVQRRLAAIVAADVAAYSRLVGLDEEGTLDSLRAHRRELIDPLLVEHGGKVANTAGDSLLLEFASVVDAVRFAVAMQQGMEKRNAGRDEARRIRFRIGVHLGDVVADGNDLLGDGVNIAARLEALAEPGGAVLSDDAYRQVRDRLAVDWRDGGEHAVKNIARPVRIWRWAATEAAASAAAGEAGPVMAPFAERPSIAVLPFKNLSGEPDQEYFADGVSEDIITALSHNRWLVVIARNSSFSFKGGGIDLKQVGAQLGSRYVLDGSIRKGGNRIRVGTQLVSAVSGKQIWAERYDRVLEDIFAVQDEVTESIVAAIAPELGKAEQQQATTKKLEDLSVWEVYQRGMWHLYQRTKEDLRSARRLFESALALDPGLSPACSAMVDAYYYEVVLGLADSAAENREKALEVARRAVALDPDDAAAHCAMGKARIVRREHALAIPDLQLAVELNPSLAWAHYGLGAAAEFVGRADEAIVHLERAIRLSPRDQHMGSFMVRLAEAYLIKRAYAEAVQWARRALQQQGFQWSRYSALLAGLGFMGEREEAQRALAECLGQRPDFSVSMVRDGHLYTDPAALEHYLEGLRRAGVPE